MAKYVWHQPNVLHVPGVIDPNGNAEKTTPGAIFAPGIPQELDDRDAARPAVKDLITRKQLVLATADDEEHAEKVEERRRQANAEAQAKAKAATGHKA